jgi:hypothetical protein
MLKKQIMHQWIQYGRRAIERSLFKALIRSCSQDQHNPMEWEELLTVLRLFNKWMAQYELPESTPQGNVDDHSGTVKDVRHVQYPTHDQIRLHEWIQGGRSAIEYAKMDAMQYCDAEYILECDCIKKFDTVMQAFDECLKQYELPRPIDQHSIIHASAANDPAISNADQ